MSVSAREKNQAIEVLDDVLKTMDDPNLGMKVQDDPYYGVDYEEDLYDAFDQTVPPGAPHPSIWRILVAPCIPRTMSKGGIELPHAVREAEEHLNYLGRVVHIGPLAGRSPKFHIITKRLLYWLTAGAFGWVSAWDYKVGDLILFGRYNGQKIFFKGARLVMMNDDEVIGRADSPKGFKIYAAG